MVTLDRVCVHCGWSFVPKVVHPKMCPNRKCQKQWPLGPRPDMDPTYLVAVVKKQWPLGPRPEGEQRKE